MLVLVLLPHLLLKLKLRGEAGEGACFTFVPFHCARAMKIVFISNYYFYVHSLSHPPSPFPSPTHSMLDVELSLWAATTHGFIAAMLSQQKSRALSMYLINLIKFQSRVAPKTQPLDSPHPPPGNLLSLISVSITFAILTTVSPLAVPPSARHDFMPCLRVASCGLNGIETNLNKNSCTAQGMGEEWWE